MRGLRSRYAFGRGGGNRVCAMRLGDLQGCKRDRGLRGVRGRHVLERGGGNGMYELSDELELERRELSFDGLHVHCRRDGC